MHDRTAEARRAGHAGLPLRRRHAEHGRVHGPPARSRRRGRRVRDGPRPGRHVRRDAGRVGTRRHRHRRRAAPGGPPAGHLHDRDGAGRRTPLPLLAQGLRRAPLDGGAGRGPGARAVGRGAHGVPVGHQPRDPVTGRPRCADRDAGPLPRGGRPGRLRQQLPAAPVGQRGHGARRLRPRAGPCRHRAAHAGRRGRAVRPGRRAGRHRAHARAGRGRSGRQVRGRSGRRLARRHGARGGA